MKHEELNWTQVDRKVYAQAWRAEDAQAVLCIIHGFAEHSGRYAEAAAFFNKNKISVYAVDLFGHGKTEGKRGFSPSYNETLETVGALIAIAKRDYPQLPVFVWGHSMGGNIVLNFLLRKKPNLRGAIATAPWLRLGFEPPKFKILLAKLMRNIYPAFPEKANLDVTSISRDPEQVRKYENDPLVHNQATAGTFLDTFEAGYWAIDNASNIEIPLLLLHGTGDKLISPSGSVGFYNNAPKELVSLKQYEGFYHELHNEPEPHRTTVLSDMLSWINAKIAR